MWSMMGCLGYSLKFGRHHVHCCIRENRSCNSSLNWIIEMSTQIPGHSRTHWLIWTAKYTFESIPPDKIFHRIFKFERLCKSSTTDICTCYNLAFFRAFKLILPSSCKFNQAHMTQKWRSFILLKNFKRTLKENEL